MDSFSLDNFVGGWFIGNFTPSLAATDAVEICLKRYRQGEREALHYQRIATEYTLVISGRCRMGANTFGPNQIVRIPPGEAADFEALEDVVLVAIKLPSQPDDKVVGSPDVR